MPDMKRSPITKEGYSALREELERLKKHERPKIIAAIEEARGHGDLSENAEYIYAKERQAFIESRMGDLEHKLGNAEIIDTTKLPSDRIVFGSKFVLCNLDTDEEISFQIVGVDESDIKKGKISVDSPMAKALIGKRIQDEIIVDTPNGKREFEIIDIVND
jgi:transcription elongation factor GreA